MRDADAEEQQENIPPAGGSQQQTTQPQAGGDKQQQGGKQAQVAGTQQMTQPRKTVTVSHEKYEFVKVGRRALLLFVVCLPAAALLYLQFVGWLWAGATAAACCSVDAGTMCQQVTTARLSNSLRACLPIRLLACKRTWTNHRPTCCTAAAVVLAHRTCCSRGCGKCSRSRSVSGRGSRRSRSRRLQAAAAWRWMGRQLQRPCRRQALSRRSWWTGTSLNSCRGEQLGGRPGHTTAAAMQIRVPAAQQSHAADTVMPVIWGVVACVIELTPRGNIGCGCCPALPCPVLPGVLSRTMLVLSQSMT